jgi:hypothetical protein
MTVVTTYETSKPYRYQLGDLKRYVRRDAVRDGYSWCEKQSRDSYDRAQGTCSASDIPERIRAAADAQRGQAFGYVVWPR